MMREVGNKVHISNKKVGLQDLSPGLILLIGLFVTGAAAVESWIKWPYAPFPIVHALLALLIPIRYNTPQLSNPLRELRSHLKLTIILGLAALVFMAGYIVAYTFFLSSIGKIGNPNWDLIAEYKRLGQLYVDRYSWTTVFIGGYLLVGVWPMFGEEFFYRGFLFKGLKYHVNPTMAGMMSSALFGFRHSLQLIYLWPTYPIVSGIAYFLWALGFALLWTWAYHHSQSIWPCIATHGANLVLAPVIFMILRG